MTRRHRIKPEELTPVKHALLFTLISYVERRDPELLDDTRALFRLWFRITRYVTNKPAYPTHDTYDHISVPLFAHMNQDF